MVNTFSSSLCPVTQSAPLSIWQWQMRGEEPHFPGLCGIMYWVIRPMNWRLMTNRQTDRENIHTPSFRTKKKQNCKNFVHLLNIKNCNKYIAQVFVPFTKYLAEAPLQSQLFFVWCDKLCSSAFGNNLPFFSSPLHLSSSVRLDGADTHVQVSPEIFDWVQAQAVAGPLKNIHIVVYKPLLLCV